jgi:uncharacterized membrane protein YfcA
MTLALLALIALVAFTVEGAIGFGGTVIAVSLGAQIVPLEVLLPAFVPISMCFSISLLRHGSIQWRTLFVSIVPLVAAGAAIGLALAHYVSGRELLVAFGCFVVLLAALQLARPSGEGRHVTVPLLALGGVVHGLFGTGGPMIVYVARKKIADKTAFRSTLAVLWIALNVILVVNLASMAHYPKPPMMLAIGAAVIPGLLVGERLHRALDAKRFERVVWVVLLLAGLALALRSL